jgi:putative peptidoglycan lipid II flippase
VADQATDAEVNTPWRQIVRNTLLVAVSFGLAALMGLLRNIIIARQFGIGADLDAYYAAFKLPDLLFTVVAGGALATAFIPVFADVLTSQGRAAAWRLVSSITNLVLLIVALFAGAAALLAPWLVHTLIAPGFDAAQQKETVDVMRIVLLSTLVFGISSVQGAALNGFKHFLLPALAPVLYPAGIICGAIFLSPSLGVRGLAVGAILGAVLHLAVKVPGLLYYGFSWRPTITISSPDVIKVAVLMGPRVLDLALFHITLLITTNLASRLPAGSVSALEWGWDAMQIPETLIGTAFGLVAFPTLAAMAAQGDMFAFRRTFGDTLRAILALSVPAALALILLGRPLLTLLYQRGAFDAAATDAVYVALRFYALGLIGHTTLELAARAFFAQKDTVTPLLVAAASAIINVLLALMLMQSLGYGGLALANSLAISVEVLILLAILRRRCSGIEGRATLQALARILGAALAMGAAMQSAKIVSTALTLSPLWLILSSALIGIGVYLGTGLLLDVKALRQLAKAIIGGGDGFFLFPNSQVGE